MLMHMLMHMLMLMLMLMPVRVRVRVVGGVRHARVVGVVLGGWWGVGIVSSCHPKGAGICRVLGLKRG
ncbi:hypothetical protein, partial [Pseudoclavibacter sp. CFCC 13611]|uniref:hypothetical protein n=1 Tax=Pseudoclavibacter sp. CFCC 13611 TaxID=2615178 RepID=UPI001CE3E946